MQKITKIEYDEYKNSLNNAALYFKLAFGLTATPPKIEYLQFFSYGQHVAKFEELFLTSDEEKYAFPMLEHCATYLCVVQVHTVLEAIHDDPFSISEPEVQSAFQIARLIRNAFAHNPFAPVWKFGEKYENQYYVVQNVISLKTSGLNNNSVTRKHYGGPLAILRLLEFTCEVLQRHYIEAL